MLRYVKADQLLHGYRSGHGLLSGSSKLPARDMELVTRLSDLSGSLSSGLEVEPYLTCYPLPSGQFYAIARTWLDPQAPRAGCVLTHTILVPEEAWGSLKNVSVIERYFTNPRLNRDYVFSSSIEIGVEDDHLLNAGDDARLDPDAMRTFVARYFGRGVRPIVWFNAVKPERYFWRLLEHLWPRLRTAFSCCTCSLQPRQLQDRPFDLLFVPSSVYPRFTKLSPEHIIGDGKNQKLSDGELEPWCRTWADALFSAQIKLPTGESELPIWNELGEDPGDLRKLTLIHELRLRAATSPTAGVGAIDVVESLAREPIAGLLLKSTVFKSAINAAASAIDVEEGLNALRLIEDRLHREAFRDISLGLGTLVERASSLLAAKAPIIAIKMLDASLGSFQEASELQSGLVRGVCETAQRDNGIIRELGNYPSTAIRLLNAEPSLAAAYLRSAGPTAPNQIATWLGTTKDVGVIRTVRKAILPTIEVAESEEVLAALLRDIDPSEVSWILDNLFRAHEYSTSGPCFTAVVDRIAEVYPAEVREWGCEDHGREIPVVAALLAATFADSPAGYEDFFSEKRFGVEQRAQVLATMIESHAKNGMPYWLRQLVAKNDRFLEVLLSARRSKSELIDGALFRILDEVPDIKLPDSMAAHFDDFAGSSIYSVVIDKVMRASLVDSLTSRDKGWIGNEAVNVETADRWLRGITCGELASLLTRGAGSGSTGVQKTFEWLANARRPLYSRRDAAIAEILDSLLPLLRQHSSESSEVAIVSILKRMREDGPQESLQTVLAKCLRFAFDNTHLALGAVVAESFPDVYRVAASDRRPSSILSLLFWSYDWDKGKDLRVALVDSFLKSAWRPAYLALASERAGILRKIFKRVRRRPRGDDYLGSMAKDLQGRSSPEWSRVRENFSSMLADPDFYEEWD